MNNPRMQAYSTGQRYSSGSRSYWSWLPRFFAAFCNATIRFLLLATVIVNLAISSVLVQRFTTIDGVTLPNTTPPSAIIFSEVVGALSTAYLLISFCFLAVPLLLLVFDTIFFVAWFAATIILGVSLSQTLRFSCQALAINVGSRLGGFIPTAFSSGISSIGSFGGLPGFGSDFGGFGGNRLAQQVFDSCNISKALFAFHIISTILFTLTAAGSAVSTSIRGREARTTPAKPSKLQQQTNYYSTPQYPRGNKGRPVQQTPGIVV